MGGRPAGRRRLQAATLPGVGVGGVPAGSSIEKMTDREINALVPADMVVVDVVGGRQPGARGR